MRNSRSRNLYLIGLLLVIVGLFWRLVDLSNHLPASTGNTPAVILITGLMFLVGGILMTVAWIGALVRTAQIQRWGWFVFLLVLSGITMLAYSFAGPETPPVGK